MLSKVSIPVNPGYRACLLIGALLGLASQSVGQVQIEQLVPSSAKGFITVPNVERFEESWDRTSIGALFRAESMLPFVTTLESQLNRRFATTGIRVGLEISDLQEVCAGEAALAFLQPDDEAQKHAIAAFADVRGKDAEVEALLKRVAKTMAQRSATSSRNEISGVEATIYEVPIKRGSKKTFKAIIINHDGMLVATDHIEVAKKIAVNLGNPGADSISSVKAYVETMKRCEAGAQGVVPEVRWYAEPIGYSELAREFAVKKKRRRTDVLAALKKQGFDALQGVGGHVALGVNGHEMIGNAFVYAPAVKNSETKYSKAAALMSYPVKGDQEVQDWIPTKIGTFITARWGIQQAYQHVGGLVDEVAGEPGFFKDLVDSLENDPNGPQINLEKEIVAHLGERVTVITSTVKPINISSERFLVAIELSNAAAMEEGLKKTLEGDPDANPLSYKDHVIWEIVSDEEFDDYAAVQVEGFGDDGFGDDGFGDDGFGNGNGQPPLLSNAAIAVVKGNFVVSSHVDFVKEIIDAKPTDDGLDDDEDYLTMRKALAEVGDGNDVGARLFTRVDREFEASYELIRTGKMPESEGLIGRLLNRFIGSDEKDVTRDPKIDGEKMPEFKDVAKFLGTMGMFIRTEDEGWYIGVLGLAPEGGEGNEQFGARPAITTAAAEDATIEN